MKKRKISQLICATLLTVYLLGVHDGKIALWCGEDPEPVKVFPCPVAILPDAEQKKLKQGIRIESMDDLNRLIEAYLS